MISSKTGITAALVSLAALLAAGCTSGQPNRPTVRASGETAPADLQLLCASETATRLGVDSTKVLPVSSSPSGAGSYRVDLTADGQPAACVIDDTGTVVSITETG